MTGSIETRRRAIEVIGNLTALLGLLVLGFPLTPSTIRSLLLGWILAVLATIQFVWGNVHEAPSVWASAGTPDELRCFGVEKSWRKV
jgi:hypothetical protein